MNNSFTAKTAFGIVILSLLLSGFLTTSAILYFQDNTNSDIAFPVSVIIGDLLLILPLLVFLRQRGDIRKILRINPVPRTIIKATVILSLGIIILADEFDRIVALIIPPPDWMEKIGQSMSEGSTMTLFLLFIGAVVLAAVVEELLFRGFLQQVLEKHWKDITKAVLVTSIFFAAIHFNPWWIIQIYLLGIFMGYLAWRSNSVFPSIIFHGMNNGLAFTFANWNDKIPSWYTWNGHVHPLVLVGGAFLTYIGMRQLSQME